MFKKIGFGIAFFLIGLGAFLFSLSSSKPAKAAETPMKQNWVITEYRNFTHPYANPFNSCRDKTISVGPSKWEITGKMAEGTPSEVTFTETYTAGDWKEPSKDELDGPVGTSHYFGNGLSNGSYTNSDRQECRISPTPSEKIYFSPAGLYGVNVFGAGPISGIFTSFPSTWSITGTYTTGTP